MKNIQKQIYTVSLMSLLFIFNNSTASSTASVKVAAIVIVGGCTAAEIVGHIELKRIMKKIELHNKSIQLIKASRLYTNAAYKSKNLSIKNLLYEKRKEFDSAWLKTQEQLDKLKNQSLLEVLMSPSPKSCYPLKTVPIPKESIPLFIDAQNK